ncbi:MAG: nucleoside diphosphate kinase regulator [Desulfobacterales bacterium]
MKDRTIFITKFDLERLEDLLAAAGEFNYRDRRDLEELEAELQSIKLVDSMQVPPTVVTMNSRVRLVDIDTNQPMIFTLTFPKDADIDAGKLSVLSPIGTAILGYAEGDIIEWYVPAGLRRIKIEKVLYQPEAAGDYHL